MNKEVGCRAAFLCVFWAKIGILSLPECGDGGGGGGEPTLDALGCVAGFVVVLVVVVMVVRAARSCFWLVVGVE